MSYINEEVMSYINVIVITYSISVQISIMHRLIT